jgi:TonB family protein
MVASIGLHLGAILWLFTLPVSPTVQRRAHPTQVTLIAPPPLVPLRSKTKPPRLPTLRFTPPQRVASLLRPAAPRISLDLPATPTLSAPAAIDLFQLPSTPPAPSPKIDNLSDVRPVPLPPPPKPRPAAGAFESASVAEPVSIPATLTRTGGFSDAAVAIASAPRKPSPAPSLTPVEIVSKPRPAYTEEARRLQIEGEVLLEAMFGASGEARVIRVVRGLGYGLDENAAAAARAIRFHPAQRGGQPVDSSALVHIIFQLAY